jgi:hypothetical protein
MSISQLYNPLSITQNSSEDPKLITWIEPLQFPVLTSKDLIHIAGTGGPGPGMTDVRDKTTALTFTNFGMTDVPDTITGIEMLLDIDRRGRISDAEIFLVYNNQLIGVNQTNYDQDDGGHLINFNKNIYGGSGNLWGATITSEMMMDPSFGIMIRMVSHPFFPHRCGVTVRQVSLRYYSA